MRVFRINPDTASKEQVGDAVVPLMQDAPLREIPFVFLGGDCITSMVDAPLLIDLADLNLAHFRASVDYEHGCHFTDLPTPIVAGYSPTIEGEKL